MVDLGHYYIKPPAALDGRGIKLTIDYCFVRLGIYLVPRLLLLDNKKLGIHIDY
jgi:hypothetical protein